MFNFKTVIVAAALALTAGVASAATETFDFTKYNYGRYTDYFDDLHVKGSEGNVVKVTAGVYGNAPGSTKVGQWQGYGLGVYSGAECGRYRCSHDSHTLDGKYRNEFIHFSFGDRDVKVTEVVFGDYGTGDDKFTLQSGDGHNVLHTSFLGTNDRWQGVFMAGGAFFLGVSDDNTYAKIKSITIMDVAEVPLPAAGWMLIAGLGGLAAMRRKKA